MRQFLFDMMAQVREDFPVLGCFAVLLLVAFLNGWQIVRSFRRDREREEKAAGRVAPERNGEGSAMQRKWQEKRRAAIEERLRWQDLERKRVPERTFSGDN